MSGGLLGWLLIVGGMFLLWAATTGRDPRSTLKSLFPATS